MSMNIKVEELMSKNVLAVSSSDTVEHAAKLMKQHNIRGLIVVEASEVAGIITDEDILRKVVAENKSNKTALGAVMTKEVVTIKGGETLADACSKMSDNDIDRLPVVDDSGSLIGVITERDMTTVYPVLMEYLGTQDKGSLLEKKRTNSGNCESCGNFSEDLQDINGNLLCVNCR